MPEATLSIGETAYPVQVLGTLSLVSNTFLWAWANPGAGQCLPHHFVDGLDMAAASQFGHHAPVAGVGLDLRTHHLGEHDAIRAGDGSGGLVTGCLDAQDQLVPSGSRHMITASSLLSV